MNIVTKAQVGAYLLVKQWCSCHGNIYAIIITGHQVLIKFTCTLGVTSMRFVNEEYTLHTHAIVVFDLWNLIGIDSLDINYNNITDCIFFWRGKRLLEFDTKLSLTATVDNIEMPHCKLCGGLSHQI